MRRKRLRGQRKNAGKYFSVEAHVTCSCWSHWTGSYQLALFGTNAMAVFL